MAGGLKEVRERIASVQNTMQITSAMKMVSAAKLRRAQDAITRMRPYAEKLQAVLANVSASLDTSEGPYSRDNGDAKTLMVVINSNRGLCGAFNNNVIKAAKVAMAGREMVHVLPLGKKSFDAFKNDASKKPVGFSDDVWTIFDRLSFEEVRSIGDAILAAFARREYDRVELVYNRFVNAAMQVTTVEQMLPLKPEAAVDGEPAAQQVEYIFEPNRAEIVNGIIPDSLKIQLYKAILDSNAAEHGARMTAMHQATENAGELLRDLRISYNKARQTVITTEILEIVAGSEALDS
jgi:F-type H+-transporting ATPase subunit gamma